MKRNILLTIFTFFVCAGVFAQDAMTMLQFEDAEKAFNNGDYEQAIKEINEVESKTGVTSKTLYLRILSEDKLFDDGSHLFEDEKQFDRLQRLRELSTKYLEALKDQEVDDKYRSIYTLNSGLSKFPKNKEDWDKERNKIAEQKRLEVEKERASIIAMFTMIKVEGGTFKMGSKKGDKDARPVHDVTLSTFYIEKYPVTQEQWVAVMGKSNEPYKKIKNYCKDCPMVMVNWDDTQEFLKKLNEITDKKYRLPTEAEWEFAARGGNRNQEYKYSGSNKIKEVAWYSDNSGKELHPVGQKKANELGLYDMSGNVSEWCNDWYDDYYYSYSPKSNPQGPSWGLYRVVRGGSWYGSAQYCRVANRTGSEPSSDRYNNLGFRVVLSED